MSSPVAPRAEAAVDLAAIRHNVAFLAASAAASGAATMAVVKADGYGHGAVAVGAAALEAGASWLGVCTITEALALRGGGITAPILSWLDLPDDDYTPGVAAGIDLSAGSVRQLAAVRGAAIAADRPARVHLKIDTGLSRNGAQPADWPDLVTAAAKVAAEGLLEVVAVWSHLAHGDEPDNPSLDRQAARLDDAWRIATDAGLHPIRHLANSAATMTRPDLYYDMVRPGIAVYGLDPLGRPVPETPLRPAMTFRSRVVLVKRVPAGEGVSYGHEWTTPKETTLALLPVGYADGVPRRLSGPPSGVGGMRVLLAGRSLPVVGRVCMDQVVVDCGDHPVNEGETAVLFGTGEHGEPTAQDWASTLGTIHYEIVTGMKVGRVSRAVYDSSVPAGAM
jgi:alanine racemase